MNTLPRHTFSVKNMLMDYRLTDLTTDTTKTPAGALRVSLLLTSMT